MGWICVSDLCEGHIVNGVWDGTGIAYFSIADEIGVLHNIFFGYLTQFGGNIFIFSMLIIIITLVISTMVNIKRGIKQV